MNSFLVGILIMSVGLGSSCISVANSKFHTTVYIGMTMFTAAFTWDCIVYKQKKNLSSFLLSVPVFHSVLYYSYSRTTSDILGTTRRCMVHMISIVLIVNVVIILAFHNEFYTVSFLFVYSKSY